MNRRLTLLIAILAYSLTCPGQGELDRLLDTAAVHNAGLSSRYASVEAARSRINRAGTWEDPRLSVGYFIQPVETRTGPQQWRFSISQMFPWFGTGRIESSLYEQMEDIEYLKWIDEREKLFMSLRVEYYRLWSIRQLLDLNSLQDEILENLEELSETRISSGAGKLSDHHRIRLSRKELTTESAILMNEYQARYRSLQEEVQTSFDTLSFNDEFLIRPTGFAVPDSLTRNPGFQVLTAQENAAYLEQEVIRQKGRPGIGAGLDYVIIGKRDDMVIPDNGRNALMPMVTVSIPVWRRKIKAATEEAEWKAKQFAMASEQFQATRKANLEMTVYEIENAIQSYNLAEEKLEILQETLELVETDFTNDQADLYDLLLLQEDILDHKKRQIKAIQSYLQAEAQFNYLSWENTFSSLKSAGNEN